MSDLCIAVIGANGFVGSQIANAAKEHGHRVVSVTRENAKAKEISRADVVIHSANPAGRYNAENNPEWDFEETVEKTRYLMERHEGKRFVLISSLSCRTQLYTQYGRHRRACELLALHAHSLVVRLGPMYGGHRKKDMLHDILRGDKVYVGRQTQYAYVDVAWAGNRIIELIEAGAKDIKEVGARNAICLADIASHFGSNSIFEGRDETQTPLPWLTRPDDPDASDVLVYAEQERKFMTL